MKNLQDNPSIAIIVCFNGGVEMYHPSKKNVKSCPKPVYDVCFTNRRTYSRLKILPLFTSLQNCC